ncbi:unnamed protein product [Durusdinium trenchii]|uniref:Calmodulin n=2 Tax=Durusdinium trenchii TaxID=1381693 RepID=A0ABP0NK76_9DINO
MCSISAWHVRSPMLDMVRPQWRMLHKQPAFTAPLSRPSSAPLAKPPGWRPEEPRVDPALPGWRPQPRPQSAPLRRSASQPGPCTPVLAALPQKEKPKITRPASAGVGVRQKASNRAALKRPSSREKPDEKHRASVAASELGGVDITSAVADVQALCEKCRKLATVADSQCGKKSVTADSGHHKERRRRTRQGAGTKDRKALKKQPEAPSIFKCEESNSPRWSFTVMNALRNGSGGRSEMERFHCRVKEVDQQIKVLEDSGIDLEPDLDDLQELQPTVVRRKESISMMRRWSRSVTPDDREMELMPRQGSRRTAFPMDARDLSRQGSRRTAMPANFELGRSDSKVSILSSEVRSTRNAVMEELDGLLDHLNKDPTEEGFSQAEVSRLKCGFRRFMIPGTIDVHKEDIFELLTFLGCVFLDPVEVRSLIDSATRYDHIGFEDFEDFMGKYTKYCQRQYRVIFDQFDEDESGSISMEELRQMTHYLGFMPTRLMVEEATQVVSPSRRALSFDELVQFLMIYRRREGFCRQEVEKLREVHKEHSDGDPLVMPASRLSAGLIQAFGRQVQQISQELQEQLVSGKFLRSSQVSPIPDPDFEPERLSFAEFLIMCRNCREALHRKLDSLWPPSIANKKSGMNERDVPGLAIKCNPHGQGTITDQQIRTVLRGLGYMPLTKAMLDIYVDVIGSPIPSDLDYDEFFDFVWRFRMNCGFSKEELEDMIELYEISDEDGSGEICTLELSTIFRSLGYRANMEQLTGFIMEVDHDKSGFLGFSEFMTLMGDFRTMELKKINKVFEEYAVGGYLQGGVITDACKNLGRHLIDREHMPEDDDEFDLEDFVDWVDECRHEAMMKERKLAGFGYWKVECFRESFKEFDRNGNDALEPDELMKLLRYMNISEAPKNKSEQQKLVKLVETARKNAFEAGIREVHQEHGNSVSFWTFVQLLRLLQTQKEKREMTRLDVVMETLQFSKFEVEQFRLIFSHWARYHPNTGLSDREIDTEVDTLTEEQVCRIFRSAGVSLVGGHMGELRVGLEPLQTDRRLTFENFLRLMRWVVDTNFAGLGEPVSK